jgi:isopenicillin N synthase-like dioxygenase
MDSLPVIDVSGLVSDDPAKRKEVAAQLGSACRGIGFFYIVNHGVSDVLRDATFAASRAFFALPASAKEKLSQRGDDARGYVAIGKERLDQSTELSDYKELYDVGFDLAADDPEVLAGKPYRLVNVWPPIPGWRGTVLAYYDQCLELSRRIHRGFALDLGVDENFFDDKLYRPLATLRMLHYPLQPADRPRTEGSGAGMHTDYGTLTILATDGVAGLQIRTRSGKWIDAPHIPGAFICNIADCLMRWTNDVYVSTPHRVGAPPSERYSIAYFLDPNPDAMVEALPSCLSSDAKPKYPPISVLDYLTERLAAARTA